MKTIFKHSIMALAAVALLGSCNEDSWNDHLDGFEQPPVYSTITNGSYTLTKANYATIAGLAANKEIAERDGETAELAAIGTNGCFQTAEQARKYIPAFLNDNSANTFYAMENRSSLNIVYNLASDLPDIVKGINAGVDTYTVTEEDYQNVWGSNDDYINSFAPTKPAASNLPAILKGAFSTAAEGQYAVVDFNESAVNPVFGNTGGGTVVEWTPTDVLGDTALGDNVEVKGFVTGICARGFILTDNSGSILCYQASGFDPASVHIGDQVNLSGEISAYNTGKQIAITSDSYQVVGAGAYSYPTPVAYTGALADAAVARSGDFNPIYMTVSGTVSISGNYYNFTIDGAETATGSFYQATDAQKAMVTDGGRYTFTGYFCSVSSGRYFNVLLTNVAAASARPQYAPAAEVPTTAKSALYAFDGTKWSVPANSYVLQPEDYAAMGQTYGNLSGSTPETLLPLLLKSKYPYAKADAAITVAYKFYNGSTTAYTATQYIFNGTEWAPNTGASSDKFTKLDGSWNYNPSIEITLPYSRNTEPSYSYYMACCQWVLDNIVKPEQPDATMTTSKYYIDTRGNAEFYSGASAYYGNVDVRATSAINNAPEGAYDGMTNDQITLLLKKRFSTQTLPYAIKVMNPGVAPVEGMEVTFTVNFTAYTGTAESHTIVYKVVGPGEFKYVSSTWVEAGQDADW